MSRASRLSRPKGTSLKPLSMLRPFLARYKGTLLLALAVLLIASAASLAMPVAVRHVVDSGFVTRNLAAMDRYFGWFLGICLVFSLFSALRYYLVARLGEAVVADIRSAVYEKVIRMDPSFFEFTRTGEVLSRLTTDTTLVQSIAGSGLSVALRSTLSLFGGLIMLVLTSPRLAGYTLVGIVAIVVPVLVVGRFIRSLSRQSQDRVADTSGLAGETLNAMQTVQSFTLEGLQSARYAEAVSDSFMVAVRRIRMVSVMITVSFALVFSMLTVFVWLGSRAVMDGSMSLGQLSQFLMYALIVGLSVMSLSGLWGDIQRAAGAMERLIELLQSQPMIRIPPLPVPLPEVVEGRIRFEDVGFCYPSRPGEPALEHFSLEVRRGETLAIVGPSGAGKTTAFQLLLRFYDVDYGKIFVDDIDISNVSPEALRGQIGLVPQETVLFGETAMENIRYGRPDASDEEVREAARLAEADRFITELPDGYDTYLGERGTRLSGGQRQRVAIARAILKDPPILLLDEATSSLDAESERLVQAALDGLMKDRTTIVIAHRLATVKKVNRILVMGQGRVEAIGSHAELIRDNPLYARLAALQFGDL